MLPSTLTVDEAQDLLALGRARRGGGGRGRLVTPQAVYAWEGYAQVFVREDPVRAPAPRADRSARRAPSPFWRRLWQSVFWTTLVSAVLVAPLALCAESDDDRAQREVAHFCQTVSVYCSKLSKADKQAMLKRFRDESPLTPSKLPEPHHAEDVRDAEGWPIPATPEERMVTTCAKMAGVNPRGSITPPQLLSLTTCVDAILRAGLPR